MTDPTETAECLVRVLRKYRDRAYRRELRPAQWDALRFFAYTPEQRRTVSGFAAYRETTIGTASITISQLVERGLLQRGVSAGGRNVRMAVTEQGRALLEVDPLQDLVGMIGQLDASDRAALGRGLAQLDRALEDSDT